MAFGKNGAHMAEPQVPGVSVAGGAAVRAGVPVLEVNHVEKVYGSQIGRASCRERVCQYV